MTNQINICKSRINVISQLLKFEGELNQQPILYKKTAKAFKSKFGIELQNAPVIFTAEGIIWKLSHMTYVHNGRKFETAEYLPIIGCGEKFKRLDRSDIYNKIK